MTQTQLRRLQWAVRATLALGVAASVTANILHARPNPIAQAIAAWPPLALLITVELVSRVPIHRKGLGAVRVAATFAIAGIAAWVSYHHMMGVVARYGETGTVPYLLPLSVDGLVVVASVSLVELAGRRRDTVPRSVHAAAPATLTRTPAVPAVAAAEPVTGTADAAGGALAATPSPAQANEVVTVGTVGIVGTNDSRPGPALDPGPDERDTDTDTDDDTDRAAADDDADDDDENGGDTGHTLTSGGDRADLAPDLVPLLPAARTARDDLTREGRTVSRDALARRMRRNGHTIRNNRVSELLAALREEAPSVNGHRPAAPV